MQSINLFLTLIHRYCKHDLDIDSHATTHSSNLSHQSTNPEHQLNKLLQNPVPRCMMKKSIFNNPGNLITIHTAHHNHSAFMIQDKKAIGTHIVHQHLTNIQNNSITYRPSPEINKSITELPMKTRRLLDQLRANKSPFLFSYLHHIVPTNHPSPRCPMCRMAEHNTVHI